MVPRGITGHPDPLPTGGDRGDVNRSLTPGPFGKRRHQSYTVSHVQTEIEHPWQRYKLFLRRHRYD